MVHAPDFLLYIVATRLPSKRVRGAGAMGVPSVSVYVEIHRTGFHDCKPLSIKQTPYTRSNTHTPCFTSTNQKHMGIFGADTDYVNYSLATFTYSIATY